MIICCLDSFFLGAAPLVDVGELPLVALLLTGEVLLLLGFLFFETGTKLLQPF
jgi:hypothetical protein